MYSIEVKRTTTQMFEDLAEVYEGMTDETIDQMLEEMEPKKFDVEEYLNSNYDY